MKFEIYEVTSMDLLETLLKKNSNSITLVDFYQPTCGPCIMLEPILEEIVDKKLANVIKVDVANYSEIGHQYNIKVTPTILIYKNNELKKTIKGFLPLEEWITIIETL